MGGKFDLHLHTKASDGRLEPEEVAARAAAQGLMCIAITDHDTTNGVKRAQAAGKALGLPVIPGVELTAEYGTELHLLGYGMDIHSPAWAGFAAEQQRRRAQRNTLMLDRLDELGLTIPEEFKPWNVQGEYGRVHMALGLIEAGHTESIQQAFDRWLGIGAAAYIKRRKFSHEEIIAAVNAAGGQAVLAHPGRMGISHEEIARLVNDLAREGLAGIEVFYPLHSADEADFYAGLADENGLVCTFGSDWHGRTGVTLAQGFESFVIPDSTYAWLEGLLPATGGF